MKFKRNGSIDFFRGFSVILMVFFTLIARFTESLPEFLEHNVRDLFHYGDLVLPFFIFASGISLAYFFNKRKSLKLPFFLSDVLYRIFILGIIWMFISPFSTGSLFGIDEIGLIMLLFIYTSILRIFNNSQLIFISLLILFSYPILSPNLNLTPYLGGFDGSFFFIPLILSGFILGRNLISKNKEFLFQLIISSFILFILFSIFFPIVKSVVSPSFILFSIFLSSSLFYLISKFNIHSKLIQYLGRNSIRYWGLMFILLLIPLSLLRLMGGSTIIFNFTILESTVISILFLAFFALISLFIDYILSKLPIYKEKTTI